MLKRLSVLVRNFSGVNIGRKLFNAFICLFDLRTKLCLWRQGRIAEPVVADHSRLIRIGDRARLELAHGREGFLDSRLHLLKEISRKFHTANVDRKIEIGVAQKIFLKTLPERRGSHVATKLEFDRLKRRSWRGAASYYLGTGRRPSLRDGSTISRHSACLQIFRWRDDRCVVPRDFGTGVAVVTPSL